MINRLLPAFGSLVVLALLLVGAAAPASAQLVINEIHADPDATNGDANNDGVVSSDNDEFVELVNTSGAELDISGYTLSDGAGVKHTFPSGTVLAIDQAIIVFGGGSPMGTFGGSIVQTTGTLGLNNGGDTVTINDGTGALVTSVTYDGTGDDEADDNQSITRDPDLTGNFIKHTLATGASGALFSPGTQVDGTSFGEASATVQFQVATDKKTEGDSDSLYVITVTLTNAVNDETVDVDIVFNTGASSPTATSADINGFTSAELSLGPGNDSGTVSFLITGDTQEEPEEDFVFDLEILNETGGVMLGSPSVFTLTINDNDAPPVPNNTLVITEFMANPDAVTDSNGEWLEVFNNTGADIDLQGYSLRDAGSNDHQIAASMTVPAGGFAVLCINADTATNGGVTCDYEYSGFTLGNTDDEIILLDDSETVLDDVSYTSSWVSTGVSTAYLGSPNGDNSVLANWAESIAREDGFDDTTPLGDDGSPGTNGVHGNLASPFGASTSAYCYSQASGNWGDSATWVNCPNGVPGDGEAAAILAGSVVTVSAATPSSGAVSVVVVEDGGTLNVEEELNADVVTVAGDLAVGTGMLNVGRDLSVQGGLVTNDAVTLLSGANGPASITNELGSITGSLTTARSYTTVSGLTGAGSFRGIFPPLAGVTFSQLNDDFQTQGGVGSDFPDAQATLYRFDAPTQTFFPITDYAAEFDPDSGYVYYMFDFEIPTSWDVTGTERGEYDLALHYSADMNADNDYNWVPQPFAGALDFRELYLASDAAASGALNGTLFVLDPATEEFVTYNAVTNMGDAGRYVAPFQSFVVQTADAGATLFYDYNIKDTATSPLIVGREDGARGEETAAHVRFELEGHGENDKLGSDQTYLVFHPSGAAGYDPGDAGMLYPFSSRFATLVLVDESGREMSMDARSSDLTTTQFEARVATTEPGTYTLSWPTFHDIPDGWSLGLYDSHTATRVDLRGQPSYTFDVGTATAERRSEALSALQPVQRKDGARFIISVSSTLTTGEEPGTAPTEFALSDVYPNPLSASATVDFTLPRAADVNLAVYDVLGRVVAMLVDGPHEAGRHSATLSGAALADGVYFIRMTAEGFAATKKVVVLD